MKQRLTIFFKRYFLPEPREIKKMISPITATTIMTPVHTPALKIPPIAAQELALIMTTKSVDNKAEFLMNYSLNFI